MARKTSEPAKRSRKTKEDEYQYVIDWINESADYRRSQNAFVERAGKAYQGYPSINRYAHTIDEYAKELDKSDPEKATALRSYAKEIPAKKSFVVQNAIETIVASTQGGVGRFEFGPYDPELDKPSRVIDKLSSAAKHFWITNKMDALMPQYIRQACYAGSSWLHLKYKNGKQRATILGTDQMITDPLRNKTNFERFIGFSQRESFSSISSRVRKTRNGAVITTLNKAQVYVDQIVNEINNKARGNQLLHDELADDLNIFYNPIVNDIKKRYANKSGVTTEEQHMYTGDDVEITYLYDLMNDKYFEVINRKYVIVGKKSDLTRTVKCEYIVNGDKKTINKEVRLDHPFVELPYMKTLWDTYAITPLFYLLDDFDDLCAMESVLYHNLSVMAPITFQGQSSDAEKVSRIASVSGEVVEGVPATFGTLPKDHNLEPIIAAIQRYEERIKRVMKATDPMELQAMIGDRATAKEVASAAGQVSQGLNPFMANIEAAAAEIGEKFIKLELIFGDTSKPYSFVHNGEYGELEAQDMVGDFETDAQLVSRIKLEQADNSRKALELVQYLGGTEEIDKKEFFGTLIPVVMVGTVSRQQAEKMVAPKYRPMPEEVVETIKTRAEEKAKRDPVDNIDLGQYSDEELDQLLLQNGMASANPGLSFAQEADMQQGIDPVTGMPFTQAAPEVIVEEPVVVDEQPMPVPTGGGGLPSSPEAAGLIANDPGRQF